MEVETMGRVTTAALIENLEDLWEAKRGLRQSGQVRSVTLHDALVDMGALALSLPKAIIQQLGLVPVMAKEALTTGGLRQTTMYEAVRLTIEGRFCTVDALEVPDNMPALIGQVPLEMLDFVVDFPNQRLIGNPAHGGQQMFEMF